MIKLQSSLDQPDRSYNFEITISLDQEFSDSDALKFYISVFKNLAFNANYQLFSKSFVKFCNASIVQKYNLRYVPGFNTSANLYIDRFFFQIDLSNSYSSGESVLNLIEDLSKMPDAKNLISAQVINKYIMTV